MSNNKFDGIIKILLPAVITIFLTVFTFMVKDIKSDVREIRINSQEYYSELHDLEMELERLKLRIEFLGVIPPSSSPAVSLEKLDEIVEMLKE